jgi:hypothetical protein
MACTCGTGWGDRQIREAPRPAYAGTPEHDVSCWEWMGEDPGKPERGQPMWQFWLMVSPMILIAILFVLMGIFPNP